MTAIALSPSPEPAGQTIRFIRRGAVVSLVNVPPSRTLLQLLREDLGSTGTKEGCGEGDCGACTVVLGEAIDGTLRLRAVNSCIKLAHSVDGLALWTVEDLASDPLLIRSADATDNLHPAQQAMVEAHGSQCGFCTPGFVMSLFGMYHAPTRPTACGSLPPEGAAAPAVWQSQSRGPCLNWEPPVSMSAARPNPITRAMAQEALSGNLCRCTGYRPILDAAQAMAALPPVRLDETALLQKMELLAPGPKGFEDDMAYKMPVSLDCLLAERTAHPDAQLVAGCTDVGLWVTKQHRMFDRIIDVTRVAELRRITADSQQLVIGAAVPLADAYAALVADYPQLETFAARFAGLPVRNAGTLGGNVANGSPIGDSMPLLIALGARVVLVSARGQRELALEDFYTGYRRTVLAADEVLGWVQVPRPAVLPAAGTVGLKVYKISKRFDDDISAVCLAIDLHVDAGVVVQASIGAGGVAATPVRALQTEAALLGQHWTQVTVRDAIATLRAEFSPISDMRASGNYRRDVLGNLLQRYWLESQGVQAINLQTFDVAALP